MQLRFGPDDEQRFLVTQDLLLDRFTQWLGTAPRAGYPPAELAVGAGFAFDWKWSYGDGHLARWRVADVRQFLLEWCPRKLSVPPDECGSIPVALAALTAFLGSEGLLTPDSAPLSQLADAAAGSAHEFVAAMGDASNFGMAKSLFGAAAADGVDLADPAQLEEWMAAFNASPEEHRRQAIPDTALAPAVRFAPPSKPALPPVALPGDDEVDASRRAARVLAMFSALATYVGDGRKLTQTGNLTLADARVLIELMATGDTMDPCIGDNTYRTRSSAELPRLRQVFAWARKAGVVRVVHGKVVATKQGLALARDPARSFERAVDALLALGALSSQRDPDWWLAWPDVNELLDRFTVHLLAGPYVVQGPLPIDDLASVAAEAVLDAFRFPSLDDDSVTRRVGRDVVDIVDALELAGVVRRTGWIDHVEEGAEWTLRRHGGAVELTAAGVVTTRRLLEEAGYGTPAAGRFAGGSATELFLATDGDDFMALRGEVEAWRRQRDPVRAAADLANAVRELDDPALRNLALAVLGETDLDIAEPEVRKLATEPGTRAFALCWLVDHGLEDDTALFDPDDSDAFVDVLVHRLVTAGPDGLCQTLALAGGHDSQIRVIGKLWRSPSTATDGVLGALGDIHPVKAVAKAARKARFQRRSLLGV